MRPARAREKNRQFVPGGGQNAPLGSNMLMRK